jgi:hypothetical protein
MDPTYPAADPAVFQDQLHGGVAAGTEVLREGVADVQRHQHLAAVDQRRDLPRIVQRGDAAEHARAVQARNQFGRRLAAAAVQQGVGDVVQVVRRRVAEDQGLHDRRPDQDRPVGLVLQDGQQLLAHEPGDPAQQFGHSGSLLRVTARAVSSSPTA